MIRSTVAGMVSGTILGHVAVGTVEAIGPGVRNLSIGDRVVVPFTIGRGYCSYCRAGHYAQCDNADPNGPAAGTAFFGSPKDTGPINGLQAEYARIPFANVGLVKLPESVSDDDATMLSDIFPTGYFGTKMAEVGDGDTVAVFGRGPVGQFAIASAKMLGAGRVIAVDTIASGLEMARAQGAEVIDHDREDPIATIKDLTGGIGADRIIDAVGADANRPSSGPAAEKAGQRAKQFDQEVKRVAPETNPQGDNWHPGDAPSQVLAWSVEAVAKAGSIGIIGVYPTAAQIFPIGQAMNKNVTIKMGNTNHRHYLPRLVVMVESGVVRPSKILSQREPLTDVIAAYEAVDTRQPGWVKVELVPAATA
ncbi:MAG: zinc-binding dehydrogenase [Chloroflexota bacterium]|nr:zinc-binding dehydrogenase [Chloroflexota bacterium]